METNKKLFSDNLRYYMALNNKTRTDLAKELNISYSTICDWVNGKVVPRPSKQDKIAELLGVTISMLFEEPKNGLFSAPLRNSVLLSDYINSLASSELERKLLNDCTILIPKYQQIIHEQVQYYLEKQQEEEYLYVDQEELK